MERVAAKKKTTRRGEGEVERPKSPLAGSTNIWSLVLPNLGEKEEPDTMEVITRIRNGLPGSTLSKVADAYQLPKTEMYSILHLTPKTGQRIQAKKLDKDKSGHVVQLLKVLIRANDIFKDHDKAMTWIKSPCYTLGDQVPMTLLDTSEGIELVMDTLGRIEYGVFA
jgi:putative toxin-antitoxin system antitoxin component (TIGR02293 family)